MKVTLYKPFLSLNIMLQGGSSQYLCRLQFWRGWVFLGVFFFFWKFAGDTYHSPPSFVTLQRSQTKSLSSFHLLRVSISCSVTSDSLQPHRLWPTRLLCPWDFPGKNTGVGCHFLLQGIFLTQESKMSLLCLLH